MKQDLELNPTNWPERQADEERGGEKAGLGVSEQRLSAANVRIPQRHLPVPGDGRVRDPRVDETPVPIVEVGRPRRLTEMLEDRMEDIEDRVVYRMSLDSVPEIHDLRSQAVLVRRAVWPLRDNIHEILKGEHEIIEESTAVFYRDVYDHLLEVAARSPSFRIRLRGTATFRPISPVVFVPLAEGISSCEVLQSQVRSGPLQVDLRFPYHPHVTVAQGVPDDALDQAFDTLAGLQCRFDVETFATYTHEDGSGWVPRNSNQPRRRKVSGGGMAPAALRLSSTRTRVSPSRGSTRSTTAHATPSTRTGATSSCGSKRPSVSIGRTP